MLQVEFIKDNFSKVIDSLKKRNKDIRKFISIIEKTLIDSINFYKINTFSDKDNIGIWYKENLDINIKNNRTMSKIEVIALFLKLFFVILTQNFFYFF